MIQIILSFIYIRDDFNTKNPWCSRYLKHNLLCFLINIFSNLIFKKILINLFLKKIIYIAIRYFILKKYFV